MATHDSSHAERSTHSVAPSRRGFLKAAGVAAAATGTLATTPHRAAAKNLVNGKLRVAVVGVEGRGFSHIESLNELAPEGIDLVGLCDIHAKFLNDAVAGLGKLPGRSAGQGPKKYDDMRRVFDDKDVDAVTFATPNHWHALGTIWACQANKDVYVEKPGSQNFAEGRLMIEAAKRHDRIVQHGTQCRSSPNIREGMEKLHAGAIGRVYMARVVNYKLHAKNMGRHNPGPPPPELNWDQWVGPGPETPFSNFNWLRYNWRWDFGVGDIGNQGVHQLDLVRYGLKLDAHPTKIQAMGGNLQYPGEDDCQCPNTLAVSYQFGERPIMVTCETRDGITNTEAGIGAEYPFVDHRNVCGILFYGTDGYMIFPDYSSYHTFLGPKREKGPSKFEPGEPMVNTGHFRNWLDAVRTRNRSKLNAEITEGHLSSALCHLGNIAYRTGRTLAFDPQQEKFANDAEADGFLARREYRSPYRLPTS